MDFHTLESSWLFQGLSADRIKELFQGIPSIIQRYEKDETIFQPLATVADPPHEERRLSGGGHDLRGVEVRALVHCVRALGDEAQRSALVDEVAHGRDDVAEHPPVVQGHDEHPVPVEGEQLGALPDVGPADRREDRVVGEEYPLVAPGELVAAVEQGDGGRAGREIGRASCRERV